MITIHELTSRYWEDPKATNWTIMPGTSGPLPLEFVHALEEFRGIALEDDGRSLPLRINRGIGLREDKKSYLGFELELRPSKDGHIRLTSHSVRLTNRVGNISLLIFMCPVECELPEHRITQK